MSDYTHDNAMRDLDTSWSEAAITTMERDRLAAYIERLEAEVEFWQKHGNVAQTIHDLTAERDEWERVAHLLAGIDERLAWAREQVDND